MTVPQQYSSQCQQPMPPPPRAAAFAATLSGRQPVRRISAQRGTAPTAFGRWLSFAGPLFVVPTTGGFEELLPPYLEADSVIVPRLMSSERAGKLLSVPRHTPDKETPPVTAQPLSAHITSQALWDAPEQESHGDSALSGVDEAYVIEDRPAVATFIKRNRLWALLLRARGPLSAAFGETTVRKLALVEDDEGFATLFCLVLIPGGLDEAKRALGRFDESWWVAHSHEGAGRVNFDFELI